MTLPDWHELEQFFGAYFHQDWDLEAATPDGVLANYMKGRSADELSRLADMIDAYADHHVDDAALSRALDTHLGCNYAHELDGFTARTWLAHVAATLRGEVEPGPTDAPTARIASSDLAGVVVDALYRANIVKESDVERALAIATEEIEVRKILGDY